MGWLVSTGGRVLSKEINLFYYVLQLFIVESDSAVSNSIKQCSEGMVLVPVVLLFAYNHYIIHNDNDVFIAKALIQLVLEDISSDGSSKWRDCVPEAPNLSIEGS